MKWISVKEKKPKDNVPLWACNEKHNTAFVCSYDGEGSLFYPFNIYDPYVLSVTHWMYLPDSIFHKIEKQKYKEALSKPVKVKREKKLAKKRKYTKRKPIEVTNEAGA